MLPIEHMILFKHGAGYFQRSGTVAGDQCIEGNVMGIEGVERIQDGAMFKDAHVVVLAEEGRLVWVPLMEEEGVSEQMFRTNWFPLVSHSFSPYL